MDNINKMDNNELDKIEVAFNTWINNYPESYHPLDQERFLVFVKTVCRYSENQKDADWLKKKIEKSNQSFNPDNLEKFLNQFELFQKFYKINI